LHDAADSEHLAHALAAAGNDHAVEDLDAFLLPFQDALVDIDGVADLELRNLFFKRGFLHQGNQSILHGPHLLSSLTLALSRSEGAGCVPGIVPGAKERRPDGRRGAAHRAPPCRGRRGGECTADTPTAPDHCAILPPGCPGRRARPARSVPRYRSPPWP